MEDQNLIKLLLSRLFIILALMIICPRLNRTAVHSKTHVLTVDSLKDKKSLTTQTDSRKILCFMSDNRFKTILDAIDFSLLDEKPLSYHNNCVHDSSSINSCSALEKGIKCSIYKLGEKLSKATSNLTYHREETSKAIQVLMGRFHNEQENLDNIKMLIQQKEREEIYKLRNDIKILQVEFDMLLKMHYNEAMNLCVSNIILRRTQTAIKLFLNNFDSNFELEEIIKIAFNEYGKLTTVINLGIFIDSLPSCGHKESALNFLFDLMFENENEKNHEILVLAAISQKCPNHSDISNIYYKLRPFVIYTIKNWGKNIQTGKVENILDVLEGKGRYFYEYFVKDIARVSYVQTSEYADAIVEFAEKMAYFEHKVIIFETLLTEMKNREISDPPYFRLGVGIMKTMKSSNCPSSSKNRLAIIKKQLPFSYVKILWHGSSCTMRNRQLNELLYAWEPVDSQRRYVVRRTGKEIMENGKDWELEYFGYGYTFRIKSAKYNEYLYTVPRSYLWFKCNNRRVFTWINGDSRIEAYWTVKPVDGKYFKIKNEKFDSYMHVLRRPCSNEETTGQAQKGVFTEILCKDYYCEWEIMC